MSGRLTVACICVLMMISVFIGIKYNLGREETVAMYLVSILIPVLYVTIKKQIKHNEEINDNDSSNPTD